MQLRMPGLDALQLDRHLISCGDVGPCVEEREENVSERQEDKGSGGDANDRPLPDCWPQSPTHPDRCLRTIPTRSCGPVGTCSRPAVPWSGRQEVGTVVRRRRRRRSGSEREERCDAYGDVTAKREEMPAAAAAPAVVPCCIWQSSATSFLLPHCCCCDSGDRRRRLFAT